MTSTLIKHASMVNEGKITETDVRIEGQHIVKIAREISANAQDTVVEANGSYLFPGMIDD